MKKGALTDNCELNLEKGAVILVYIIVSLNSYNNQVRI